MAKKVLVQISEEYGYQHWWALYTIEAFNEIRQRWKTMRGLNCLVPVDLIFPGARGCFGDWPPAAICENVVKDCVIVSAHVHECDDSYLQGVTYNIPPNADENDDSFEIDGRVYSRKEIDALFDESRKRRNDEFFTAHPEYAPTAAGAEPETGE
jgi:hypothetical protein